MQKTMKHLQLLLRLELKGLPPTVNHLYRTSRKTGRRYKTSIGKLYQDYVTLMLSTLWGSRPAYTGAIELRIKLISSDRRKWDIDNRVKALQDCLELGGVVKNDTQVEILHVEREYGERSATYIEINAL